MSGYGVRTEPNGSNVQHVLHSDTSGMIHLCKMKWKHAPVITEPRHAEFVYAGKQVRVYLTFVALFSGTFRIFLKGTPRKTRRKWENRQILPFPDWILPVECGRWQRIRCLMLVLGSQVSLL